jgi:predicted permease
MTRHTEGELDEEPAFHIERETRKQIAAGLSPRDARTRALARFGPVPLAADQCRDARGTSVVDDLGRDVRYAFRTFGRAPLAALTIVATVAVGLGLVAVVFTVFNMFFLRVDAVRNPGELYAVELHSGRDDEEERIRLTRADYDALRRETSVLTDAFGMMNDGDPNVTRIDGRPAIAVFVTGNFFQALGVQAALGRPLTPGDDEPAAGHPAIVLSHAGWRKLFQEDQAVIGRRVVADGAQYEIVGVMPDGFRGLGTTPPDLWAPTALSGRFRDGDAGREDEIPVEVIGRLKPGLSPEAAGAALSSWASGRLQLPPSRQIRVSLTPRQGTLSSDGFALVFSPLFFAFGLILAIGCANVANLLLARGVARQREIGIRLSLGASRRRIIRQLLTESLLLALAAAACGVIVSWLFLEVTLHIVIATLPPEIAQFVILFNLAAPTPDWRLLLFIGAGAIVSTVFFGLAPALQATRLELVPTMRGEVTRDARPGRARHALIAVQVGASALLLIGAVIFLRGALRAATAAPGARTSDTVKVSIANEPRRAALLQAATAHPLVVAVAAAAPQARGVIDTSLSSGAGGPSRLPVGQQAVSSEYFDLLGIDVVSGRRFTQAERTAEAGVVVVSESIARQLWPKGDGVGQVVRVEAPPSASPDAPSRPSAGARSTTVPLSRTMTVVGVVRDSSGSSAVGVYLPTGLESPDTSFYLRVRGNPEQARQALVEGLSRIDPAVFILTMRAMARMGTYMLQLGFWLTVALGGLALVLTVSGLFSVLSYVVEQQAKEIGVRMALGATTRNVAGLVLSQSIRPVGIGLAAGGGLAAAVAIVLMATPAAAEIGNTVNVLDPVAYAAGLLVIVTSCALAVSVPALRAARIDPIATLRKD